MATAPPAARPAFERRFATEHRFATERARWVSGRVRVLTGAS
jgi:hypothetical protein